MIYPTSAIAITVFALFVGLVLGLSFFLGRKAKSAKGFYAADGEIHWFVNGIAFAGDYLSAASFLGICGMIAFFGYDGFLYSIGYLAGWIVALFVIAEPIKRLGKYTFASALDSRFQSKGIKFAAAVSTLVVSVFYLIPQMVGAGSLCRPLLGFEHYTGVLLVGGVVILIVVTAGMVSTTWVQFIKGSLLVIFCAILTVMILNRGLVAEAADSPNRPHGIQLDPAKIVPETGGWVGRPFVRVRDDAGGIHAYRNYTPPALHAQWAPGYYVATDAQLLTKPKSGPALVNGLPQSSANDLHPVGTVASLPGGSKTTGATGPMNYLATLHESTVFTWSSEKIAEADGSTSTVYFPVERKGSDLLLPGNSSTFKGLKSPLLKDKLNFLSLMLALFCGTASLPHILIRYYTVKDAAAARKSTVVGIASIGFFYVLTLFLGLGAMTSGALDPTDSNMAAPLLARSFNPLLFAIISAIAFTTVLGTVSGLIMAASGAVAHDILSSLMNYDMKDHHHVNAGKVAAIVVGVIAMGLGMLFKDFNVTFLVGWAFNVAASANLPALVMLLFWKRTTKQGIAASILVGLVASVGWILLSSDAYQHLYKIDPKAALAPFNQPGIVTIPLAFLTLVIVSLVTQPKARAGFEVISAAR